MPKTYIQLTDSGYGDIIQLAQAMPHFCSVHEHVVLEVQPSIRELIAYTLKDLKNLTLVTKHTEGEPGDTVTKCWFALGTEVMSTTPPGDPFIKIPRPWAKECHAKPQIGLAWASHHWKRTQTWDNRSLPAEELIDAFVSDHWDLHSLHPDRNEEIESYSEEIVRRHAFADFTDTAAFIASTLDYVVSVDTWAIHLAPALGVRTLGLLPFASAKNANELRRWYKNHLTTFQPRQDMGMKVAAERARRFLEDDIAVCELTVANLPSRS